MVEHGLRARPTTGTSRGSCSRRCAVVVPGDEVAPAGRGRGVVWV